MIPFRFLPKKKLKKRANYSKLYLLMRFKFIISFLLLTLIPSSIICFVIYRQAAIEDQQHNQSKNISLIMQTSAAADSYMLNMESLTQLIANDKEISYFLKRSMEDTSNSDVLLSQSQEKYQLYITSLIQKSEWQNKNLSCVRVLFNNSIYTLYNRNKDKLSSYSYSESILSNESSLIQDKPFIIGTGFSFFENGHYDYIVSAAKKLSDSTNTNKPGILIVDVSYDAFSSSIVQRDFQNYKTYGLFIVDHNNNIMYNKDSSLLTTKADINFFNNDLTSNPQAIIIDVNGTRVYAAGYESPYSSWKTISLLPVSDAEISFLRTPYILIGLVSVYIFVVLLFTLIISSVLLKPINELITIVSNNSKRSFMEHTDLKDKIDDVIGLDAPDSMPNMGSLIHKVYNTQLEQKEAQLKALQNQINPHFLYNTLESIRGAALYHGIDSIAEMSKRLSLLFRYSINDNVLVSLRDEIQNLENYIAIQNFRHDDRFELSYNVTDKQLNYKILKLTLQPLVENSIKHGLENKLDKGRIKIEIVEIKDVIQIILTDDGIGILPEKTKELNIILSESTLSGKESTVFNLKEIDSGKNSGIGIVNVNSRIKLYFGEQYGLSYKDCKVGTTVEITLPVVY